VWQGGTYQTDWEHLSPQKGHSQVPFHSRKDQKRRKAPQGGPAIGETREEELQIGVLAGYRSSSLSWLTPSKARERELVKGKYLPFVPLSRAISSTRKEFPCQIFIPKCHSHNRVFCLHYNQLLMGFPSSFKPHISKALISFSFLPFLWWQRQQLLRAHLTLHNLNNRSKISSVLLPSERRPSRFREARSLGQHQADGARLQHEATRPHPHDKCHRNSKTPESWYFAEPTLFIFSVLHHSIQIC
jgi:hypothetical protein